MHPSLETILELELNLDQLRQAGDWQTALPRIDTHLQEAFGENGNPPDHLADLCLVGMLAVQKAQLLQELTGVILINGETGELTPAMASERQQEFVGQSLNWFQIGLAACQRGIARLPEEPGSPWHRFLHHQLTEIRRGFLAISAGESASQLKNHLSLIRHLFSLLWMGSDLSLIHISQGIVR